MLNHCGLADCVLHVSTMSLDPIDQQIEDWKSKVAAASDNLLALYDHPTYKRLKGGDGQGVLRLTGMTAAQVGPALASMDELFAQMGLLTDVIDRAEKLRQSRSRFSWNDRSEQEIEELLGGASIELPPIQTPLEKRGLLTAAQKSQAITPADLLQAMTRAFDGARTAVFAVDAAWNRLDPVLASADTKLATLEARAKSLGADAVAETVGIRSGLTTLRTQAESDPLATVVSLDKQFAVSLETLRKRLESMATERTTLTADFEAAGRLLSTLDTDRASADAALAKCRRMILEPDGLQDSMTDQQIAELRAWLSTLTDTFKRGQWKAARVGIDRWTAEAREYADVQSAAVAANQGPLDMLVELQGRLSALHAKANARGIAALPYLAQLAGQANQLIARPPVPLARVSKLVADYERAVDAADNRV